MITGLMPVYTSSNEYIYMTTGKCYQTKEEQEYVTKRVSEIIDELNINGKNRVNQLYKINEWMKNNIEYDHEKVDLDINDRRTAYSALINGFTVCTGYSQLAKEFCRQLDIPCDYVEGSIPLGGKHETVIVQMENDLWYYWDPTDDIFLVGEDNKFMNTVNVTNHYDISKNEISKDDYGDFKIQLTDKEIVGNNFLRTFCSKLNNYFSNKDEYNSTLYDCVYGPYVYYELYKGHNCILYIRYLKMDSYEKI